MKSYTLLQLHAKSGGIILLESGRS